MMKITRITRLSNNHKVTLSCLVIAILLWLIVVMGNSYLELVEIPFEITNSPAGHVLSRPIPDAAEVVFNGNGFDLIELLSIDKYVELDMRNIDLRRKFSIREELIRGVPQDFEVEIERIVGPDTVTVILEQWIEKRVRVSRKFIRLEPKEGYTIVGPVTLTPDSVSIYGPESAVNQIDSVITESETFSHLIRDFEGELALVPPVWDKIKYSRTAVRFSADVQRIHERHIYGVPVRVTHVPASVKSVRTDPSVLTLTVHGGVDAVSKLTVDDITATIDYQKERHRSQEARAVILMPPNLMYWTSKPGTFKLRIER